MFALGALSSQLYLGVIWIGLRNFLQVICSRYRALSLHACTPF